MRRLLCWIRSGHPHPHRRTMRRAFMHCAIYTIRSFMQLDTRLLAPGFAVAKVLRTLRENSPELLESFRMI